MAWSEKDEASRREAAGRQADAENRVRLLQAYGIATVPRYVGGGRTDGGVEMGPETVDRLLTLLARLTLEELRTKVHR